MRLSPKIEHQNGVEGLVSHRLSRFAVHFDCVLFLCVWGDQCRGFSQFSVTTWAQAEGKSES